MYLDTMDWCSDFTVTCGVSLATEKTHTQIFTIRLTQRVSGRLSASLTARNLGLERRFAAIHKQTCVHVSTYGGMRPDSGTAASCG
jgi:hypothetical protein